MTDEIPDNIKEYIIRSTQYMETQVKLIEKIEEGMSKRDEADRLNEEKWRNTIETLNRDFALHKVDTETKLSDICVAMTGIVTENKAFRDDTWQWAKGMITKFAIALLGIIALLFGVSKIPGL
jgi:hypothetical protein